jgi:hypothetical protein
MADLFTKNVIACNSEAIDLMIIRGIGAVRQQWLKSIGIQTIQDLAEASAEPIAHQLKQAGCMVSRHEIAGWIAQAQDLTIEPLIQLSPASSSLAIEPSPLDAIALASVSPADFPDKSDPVESDPVESDTWNSAASFVVEFQTRSVDGRSEQRTVVRQSDGQAIKAWSGLAIKQLPAWMENYISPTLPQPERNAPPPVPPVSVEITQVRLVRSPQLGMPMVVNQTHRLFQAPVAVGEPFALEISIQFAGLTMAELEKQPIVYRAQCYARHLFTRTTINLGEIEANVPFSKRSSYTAFLPEVSLQQPGVYRLQIVIMLQDRPTTSGCFKVPMLQVMGVA